MKQLEESKKRKAVKKNKAGFEAMQPCYEVILQIGNCETVNSRVNETHDPNKLDMVLAEEMLLEAIEKTKSRFTVPAVDWEGNSILDEDGNQKMWCCIEIVGLYIHDDEMRKGVHAHIDYVPVARNYDTGVLILKHWSDDDYQVIVNGNTLKLKWLTKEDQWYSHWFGTVNSFYKSTY